MTESYDELCARLDRENAALDADPRMPDLLKKYEAAGCVCPEMNARMEVKKGKPQVTSTFVKVGDRWELRSLDEEGKLTIEVIDPSVPPPSRGVVTRAKKPAPEPVPEEPRDEPGQGALFS